MEFDAKAFAEWVFNNGRCHSSALQLSKIIEKFSKMKGVEQVMHDVLTLDNRVVVDMYTTGLKKSSLKPYKQAVRKYEEYLRKNNIVCESTNSERK